MQPSGTRIVYVLRSEHDPERRYIGITSDLTRRLAWHNSAPSGHTVKHRPWHVLVAMHFADEQMALKFERYLKAGSGRAFAERHFG